MDLNLINYICVGIFLLITCSLLLMKYCYVRCNSNVCLVGKTALVTGGSSGLGYQFVLFLASRGCKVIIVDKVINDNIKKAIINATDNTNIVLEYADFGSFTSVRKLAERLKQSESKLDILVNNAGIVKCSDVPSEDGLNLVMQINHYSPFLLTHLLVDLLKKSEGAKILFTSSIASFSHSVSRKTVTSTYIKNPSSRNEDYSNSKFCTVVVSDMFAKKLKKWNITSNSYHPGIAKTPIFKNLPEMSNFSNIADIFANIFQTILLIFCGNDANIAAQTGLNLIVSKEFKNVTGIFYGKYCPNLKPKGAKDECLCNMIWEASEHIVQLKQEEKI